MERYRRVKVLGKGSFGTATLVTKAGNPSEKYVVVRPRHASSSPTRSSVNAFFPKKRQSRAAPAASQTRRRDETLTFRAARAPSGAHSDRAFPRRRAVVTASSHKMKCDDTQTETERG
jgi:hypothetical protein